MRHGVQVNITLYCIISTKMLLLTIDIHPFNKTIQPPKTCNKTICINFYPSVLDSDHNGYLDFKVICDLAFCNLDLAKLQCCDVDLAMLQSGFGNVFSKIKNTKLDVDGQLNPICLRNFSRRLIWLELACLTTGSGNF